MSVSAELWQRATEVIAGGASSNARMGYPFVVERGEGPWLIDADGNRQIDYLLGMGPAILGHAPPVVLEAVTRSLALGQLHGATLRLEIELAERIRSLVPSMERMRFTMTGTEADQAALRLARAFTGRRLIVKFEGHYHGWLDNVLISLRPDPAAAGPAERPHVLPETPGQAPGALSDTVVLPWNDLAALEALLDEQGSEIAGVIMEPVMCNTLVVLPLPGYLQGVRTLCDRHGVVLILDEVITGFRVGLGGAQGLFGVRPDLSVFAKALAGGFPLACIGGRAEIMELVGRGVFHGGTYNACLPAVAAALATLEELARDDGAALRHAQSLGETLMTGLRERALRRGIPMLTQGYGTVFTTAFTSRNRIRDYRDARGVDEALFRRFAEGLREQGVRVSARGNWYVSTSHGEAEIAATLDAADRVLAEIGAEG
jgi:glutamate-1-semialdehyde 2,1-aminomutase